MNSSHASSVLENFYGLGGVGPGLVTAMGIAELTACFALHLLRDLDTKWTVAR